MTEFELIARYFVRDPAKRDAHGAASLPPHFPAFPATAIASTTPTAHTTALGIGDDCALICPKPGMQLAISSDMLVAGRHFFPDCDPYDLGHKSLAVNLSDLAAMGAHPLAFTLAIALPAADPDWLAGFSAGLFALADRHQCELIGGDTTRGPLTISITIFGEVPPGRALQRNRAQVGDQIWVSGTLGDARLALFAMQQKIDLSAADLAAAAPRLLRPTPRVELGLALQGSAHAAIDLSDGLQGDLGHLLSRSACGARLNLDALPCGPVLAQQGLPLRRAMMLSGGDDYELLFTAAPDQHDAIVAAAAQLGVAVCPIGQIEAEPGLRLQDGAGQAVEVAASSFDHFG